MWEKIKTSLDEAYQGMKSGASKVTLKTEEKAKLAKMNMKINAFKKDMNAVMVRLGNRIYTLREEQNDRRVFQDVMVSQILEEADELKNRVEDLQKEMEHLKEDYEARIRNLGIQEGAETTSVRETKSAKAGQDRKAS